MCFKVVVEDLVEVHRLLFKDARDHFDAGVSERLYALSGHQRVDVQRGDEHAADALLDDDLGAGRRPAVVAAGLKRHVEVRAGGVLLAPEERIAFRVVLPDLLVVPLADDAAVLHDDTADHRVRAHMPFPAPRQLQRPPHIFFVFHNSSKRKSLKRKLRFRLGDSIKLRDKRPCHRTCHVILSHPDCTVGTGIPPVRAKCLRTLPPVGKCSLPRRRGIQLSCNHYRSIAVYRQCIFRFFFLDITCGRRRPRGRSPRSPGWRAGR